MGEEKNLLKVTKEYLIKKMEAGTISAQEIEIAPKIAAIEVLGEVTKEWISNS